VRVSVQKMAFETDSAVGPALSALVVDDSAAQRALVAASLARMGYTVAQAGSGEDALDHCAVHHVDLILSDWMMPGLSGIDFCRRFRSFERESYCYFILLTSHTDKEAVAEGLDAGADDFLSKPFEAAELRARIRAGERIIQMQRELTAKNRLVGDTLARLQGIYDSLDRDLAQARLLQQSLLREPHHRFATSQVSLMLRPSGHVGGDLVGFFPIDDRRVGLFGLDVSGHGVTSALLTARIAGLFSGNMPGQNIALSLASDGAVCGRAPANIAAQMNDLLLREIATDHYCTLCYAELDVATGAARLVQAGHPHPMIQRANGRVEVLGCGGLPVGLVPDARYATFETRLFPGDRLFIVSDGITECPALDGTELGEDGTASLLQPLQPLQGARFEEAMIAALGHHAGTADFRDDVSCLLFTLEDYGCL
jgi:sigma-B regulation protein RsbU (phosphoserine phosphatase)